MKIKFYGALLLFSIVFSSIYTESGICNSFDYPLVFVSRNHRDGGNINFPSAGLLPGMGPHSRFAKVGGRLLRLDANGTIVTLVDSLMNFNGIKIYDVQQPCVHWTGQKIVFAGVEHPDSSWRIYEIRTDGTGFKKITFTDRAINLSQFGSSAYKFEKYDDIDPVYTPDNNIVFASTRYPQLSEKGFNATNLFIVYQDTALYRMTTERNGAEKPTVDPLTGTIVYSRWWLNIDRPSNLVPGGITRVDSLALPGSDIANIWQPVFVKPDGDALNYYSGDPRTRRSMFLYRPRIMHNGDIIGVYSPDITMTTTGGSNGIRSYELGLSPFKNVIGVDTTTPLYSTTPPSYNTMMPPYATDPVELPNGKILFSYATSVEALDYGIYTCNPDGSGLTPVLDFPGTMELNAEPIVFKPIPPIVEYLRAYDVNNVPPTSNPSTFYQGGLFRFDCLNIFANAPVDAPIENAPPITKNARIRFFLQFQRTDENGQDPPILFRDHLIQYDGAVIQGDIPSNVSMFEQITDSVGNVLVNREGNPAHVTGMNFGIDGSGTKCVGCHAGHTLIDVPINNTLGEFTNVSTSATTTQSSYHSQNSIDYTGDGVVDRKARNNDLKVNWIAGSNVPGQYVELKWDLHIDVKSLKLYNILPNPGTNTNIQVNDCEVFMYDFDSILVEHVPSTGPLTTDGLKLNFPDWPTINKIKVVVKDYTGTVNNLDLPGLAEVETEARIGLSNYVGIEPNGSLPYTYSLQQNYPNPFNPVTQIRFTVPSRSYVSLKVFDITGREIETLVEGYIDQGSSSAIFSGSKYASGIYFYRIIAESSKGSFTETKKMVLIK